MGNPTTKSTPMSATMSTFMFATLPTTKSTSMSTFMSATFMYFLPVLTGGPSG